jgi:NAD(P)-dependent dehydrogenase (short-subunit alcohol dehydrogenase family)
MGAVRGQVVAVTGGAAGIGREIARQLAEAGAQVAIGDRDAEAARTAAAELPGPAEGFALDVTSTDSFRAFLDLVAEHLGPVDVLVNNAGVMWVGPFDEEPESAAQRQIDVNLHGVVRGVKLAAPAMRERGRGQIVTIASAASKLPPPGEATYAATKHAVHGYLSAARAELRGSGVELSLVMPGVVDTDLALATATGPVRRLRPAEVAAAVLGLIRRPRFEVSVPRRVGLAGRLSAVLPDRLRREFLRLVVPDQVAAVEDPSARADYETRALSEGDL